MPCLHGTFRNKMSLGSSSANTDGLSKVRPHDQCSIPEFKNLLEKGKSITVEQTRGVVAYEKCFVPRGFLANVPLVRECPFSGIRSVNIMRYKDNELNRINTTDGRFDIPPDTPGSAETIDVLQSIPSQTPASPMTHETTLVIFTEVVASIACAHLCTRLDVWLSVLCEAHENNSVTAVQLTRSVLYNQFAQG